MTLKNLLKFPVVLTAFVFTGCNSGSEETADINSTDSVTASPVNAYLSLSDSNSAQSTSQPATSNNTAGINLPALNPAHGQPGHDCAVEVGAPLPNKSRGATTTQPVSSQPAITANPTLQQPATSGAKLNPAHGQPGHDCAVAVGAPLNSAPTSATATPASQAPIISTQPSQPLKTNAAGVKLNPAHGQPGHDCAVEVGAPLKN